MYENTSPLSLYPTHQLHPHNQGMPQNKTDGISDIQCPAVHAHVSDLGEH